MALKLQALLMRVQQSCARQQVDVPHSVLAWARSPEPRADDLAECLRAAWLVPASVGKAPAEWQWQLLAWVIEQAWAERTVAERLDSPLLAPWLRAAAALGRRSRLAEFEAAAAADLAASGRQAQAMLLLRALRQVGAVQATRRLAHSLISPAHDVVRWEPEVAQSVAMVARRAEALPVLQWAGAWLKRWLPLVLRDGSPPAGWSAAEAAGFDAAVGAIANRTVQLAPLRQLCAHFCRTAPAPELEVVLAGMLSTLVAFEPDDDTLALMERAAACMPNRPAVQLERAKLARLRGADDDALCAMLSHLQVDAPGFRSAMSWLANSLFHGGNTVRAQEVFERLDASHGLNDGDRLRLQHLRVRDVAAAADESQGTSPDDSGRPRFDGSVFKALAPQLQPLAVLINQPPQHTPADSGEALAGWARQCDAAESAFAGALASAHAQAGFALLDSRLALAQQLSTLADEAYANHAKWLSAFPFPLSEPYGRVDGQRSRLARRAIYRHVVMLFEQVLTLPQPLQGAPEEASLRSWLVLLRLACDACLHLEQADDALALVQRAQQQLGSELGRNLVQLLLERCHLALAQVRQAAALRAGMSRLSDAAVVSLHEWPEWARLQGLELEALVADLAVPGHFETVAPDGVRHRHAHATVPVLLQAGRTRNLVVRISHGLLSERAGLLLPHAWHRMMGDYPYSHPDVLNRAAGGAVLRKAAQVRQIVEPVVVLANMDVLVHRNYYHWTLFVLARACWLQAHGMLAGRRLLVPQEMSRWMFTGLADVGIDASGLLTYDRDEQLNLADALVVSPVEFAGPSLCDHLRSVLWRAAGLDPAAPPQQDKLIYVSRRGENRRPLKEEDALSALAEAQGFEVVAPETLGLLDQVRLFARARAIVSPPGAALTNLLWTSPGVRLLVVFKEEAAPPFFVDLALLRGLHYRWLMGRNLPQFSLTNVVNAPFSVDLALAARELAWAAGAGDDEGTNPPSA